MYDILCPTAQLRADLEDVQLHPVKKNLFIKFRSEISRDTVADMLAGEGLEWPAFETRVQGWAMDKPVVFVRVLGASPESRQEDIKGVMGQYGEVIEVRKGQLSKKLQNVTNGTWTVRMILGEDKIIPSFVFVSADGEIWQLTHDNQETICWKCGQSGHIGSWCRQRAVSIDADLLPVGEPAAPPVQAWAHVVRGDVGQAQLQALEREQALARQQALEREQADRVQAERLESEKREFERLETERRETERLESERLAVVREVDIEKPVSKKAADQVVDEQAVTETAKRGGVEAVERVTGEEAVLASVKAASNSPEISADLKDTEDANSLAVEHPSAEHFESPAKFSKMGAVGAGSAFPSGGEAVLGSSPVLFHKTPKSVEDSQLDTRIISEQTSGLMDSHTQSSGDFIDLGSSKNMLPSSSSNGLE